MIPRPTRARVGRLSTLHDAMPAGLGLRAGLLRSSHCPRAYRLARASARDTPPDDELAAVNGTMMSRAGHDERVGIVISALGTKLDVMEIEKDPVATAWNHAAPAVASHHLTTHGRRNVLPCALRARSWRGRVGHSLDDVRPLYVYAPDMLRVAMGCFHDT